MEHKSKNPWKVAIIILGVIVLFAGLHSIQLNGETEVQMEKQETYLGPVPENYDEEHYRETGITKPLED